MMAQSVAPAVPCNDPCFTLAKRSPATPPQLGLLALPDAIVEDILDHADLSDWANARMSCRALCDLVTRPAMMQRHLMRATRKWDLPASQAALSRLMQRQLLALRHLQAGACKVEKTSDEGNVLDVAQTPAGERIALTRPPGFNGMRICDASGAARWQVRTPSRESCKVPPKLAGDASTMVYLVRPQAGMAQNLYIGRAGCDPTILATEEAGPITYARFGPYDSRLAVVQAYDTGEKIICFDTDRGAQAHAWSTHNLGTIAGIAYADDQTSLVSGHHNGRGVHLWDIRKPGGATRIAGAMDSPTQLVFTPDGQRLFVGGSGGLQVWDRRMDRAHFCFTDRRCQAIAIAPDGFRMATKEAYGDDARLAPWRLRVYSNALAWQAPLWDHPTDSGDIRFTNDGTGLYVQGKYSGWFLDFTVG